jgi:hypothetical protein
MEDRGLQAGFAVAGRVLIAVFLLTLIGAYTYAVLAGVIGEKQRIDATHLAAILIVFTVCAVLLLPGLTSRIKTLELQGFKLDLERVRERQRRQEVELEDVRLLIPLLLPDAERKHLTDLAAGLRNPHARTRTVARITLFLDRQKSGGRAARTPKRCGARRAKRSRELMFI